MGHVWADETLQCKCGTHYAEHREAPAECGGPKVSGKCNYVAEQARLGRRYSDIADELGVSAQWVSTLATRAGVTRAPQRAPHTHKGKAV